MTSEQERWTTS